MDFPSNLEATIDLLGYRKEMEKLLDDGVVSDVFQAAEVVTCLVTKKKAWENMITELGRQGLAFSVPDENDGPPPVPVHHVKGDRYRDPAWFWVLARMPAWADNMLVWIFRPGWDAGLRQFDQPIKLGKRFHRYTVPGLSPPKVIRNGEAPR
jgi:hypothetical protein